MWALPAVVIALLLVSYRDLIGLDSRFGAVALESWFTRPTGLPFPLALCGAIFLLGRRRRRWQALPEGSASPGPLATAALLGSAALLVWARLTGVTDLLVESLALLVVAVAASRKGPAGARLAVLPAGFLLLALSPSPAAVNELFWFIQVHTARLAAAVVDGLGLPVLLETVLLTRPEETFAVIESCASLGVMAILVALSVLLREQLAGQGARSWWLVGAAVPLSVLLNLVRVVAIILWPATNRVSHGVQWAVLLGFGALILAEASRRAARRAQPSCDGEAQARTPVAAWPRLRLVGVIAAAGLAGLSLLPRPTPRFVPAEPIALSIPLEHAGWTARDVAVDRRFLGWVRFREIVSRVYQRESDLVRLFVGLDDSRARTASPFSSKTLLPGFGWIEVGAGGVSAGAVRSPETAIVARESARWWVAQWRLGYHGFAGEALRHVLAIDASPFTPPRARAVVRLRVPLRELTAEARASGVESLERFLTDFREFLPLHPGSRAALVRR